MSTQLMTLQLNAVVFNCKYRQLTKTLTHNLF